MTYSETKGEAFDWRHALSHPEEYQHDDLVNRAHDWPTCAVGDQCESIPRNDSYEPLDAELSRLGRHFYVEVREKEWEWAKATLSLIEARAAVLIAS